MTRSPSFFMPLLFTGYFSSVTVHQLLFTGPRGSRSVGGSRSSGIRKSIPGNQQAKATPPTCPKLKTKIPSSVPAGIQLVEPQFKLSFEVGDNLEVLRRGSGLRGCWFRCKVLKVSEKCLNVQYDDIQDYDGPDKLKEWVSSYRVVDSDKLGMRCTGRLTIRPRPPEDFSDCSFEVGAAVDA
ncbi:putative calponin -like proteiny domain-containing protein-like [Capsicum annuum]|nr:putative calponin -like proteiny domain-containing protein-like [Capsicum annuum]